MLADARQYMNIAPWLSIFPGVAITIALLGVNLFGDALRDRFDPRVGR
jgi:peptide/nickel transport system permease protein